MRYFPKNSLIWVNTFFLCLRTHKIIFYFNCQASSSLLWLSSHCRTRHPIKMVFFVSVAKCCWWCCILWLHRQLLQIWELDFHLVWSYFWEYGIHSQIKSMLVDVYGPVCIDEVIFCTGADINLELLCRCWSQKSNLNQQHPFGRSRICMSWWVLPGSWSLRSWWWKGEDILSLEN